MKLTGAARCLTNIIWKNKKNGFWVSHLDVLLVNWAVPSLVLCYVG